MFEQKRMSKSGFTPRYFMGIGLLWIFLAGLLVYVAFSDPRAEIFCLVFGVVFVIVGVIFVGIGLVIKFLWR